MEIDSNSGDYVLSIVLTQQSCNSWDEGGQGPENISQRAFEYADSSITCRIRVGLSTLVSDYDSGQFDSSHVPVPLFIVLARRKQKLGGFGGSVLGSPQSKGFLDAFARLGLDHGRAA